MSNDVAVVIVAYNSARVIGSLLDSLPAALGDLSYEVVVVDNGSADNTVSILRERGDCLVVTSSNVGYGAGINRGVTAAGDAGAILVLNPDVRMAPLSVVRMHSALAQPHTGVVSPRIESPEGALQTSLRRTPTILRAAGLTATKLALLSEYVQDTAEYLHPQVVDWALGAVLLVSQECHRVLGGWDESYFLYSEETDFCLRARDLGFLTRYEPTATAVHIGAQSGQDSQTHAMQIINRVRLYGRRHRRAPTYLYLALTVFSEATWVLRGHRRSRFAIVALLRPRLRPAALGCNQQLIPD